MKGKEKKLTGVFEVVDNWEIWIWAFGFGEPVSMNDINVMDCYRIAEKILRGEMLPDFNYEVKNKIRKLCYYLVDGIYPKWVIFVSTISEALSRKETHFCFAQEGMRKVVERAFGVLVSI